MQSALQKCSFVCTLFSWAWLWWTALFSVRTQKVKLFWNTTNETETHCCSWHYLIVALCAFADCIRGTGVEYRGYQQSTSSGLTCLKWRNSTRDYDLRGHPDSQTGKYPTLNVAISLITGCRCELCCTYCIVFTGTFRTPYLLLTLCTGCWYII